ncbi:FAD-dependent oxidoreductase [Burkholderiales bacterium]|nr:FAD-dependent oxidoreductase [Burkholderiales bacterium]
MNKPHVVIIGSGISGLSACWHLRNHANITVIEKANYLGGHTHTHTLEIDAEPVRIDSGFIVFNDRTYPGLRNWFSTLEVESHPADMSFSVSLGDGEFEWAGSNLRTIFAQGRRVYDLNFLKMLRDILRFNSKAPKDVATYTFSDKIQITLGEYLDQEGYDTYFQNRYLLPMAGAIWSCPLSEIRKFPLKFFVYFCENHGLLSVLNRPKWFSVKGGSQTYIDAMLAKTSNNPISFRKNTQASSIKKTASRIEVTTKDFHQNQHLIECDHIVFASHADDSAQILNSISHPMNEQLSKVKFQANTAVIHEDAQQMPRLMSAWASWNYLSHTALEENPRIAVTYFMNKLQHLPTSKNLFVTLNPVKQINPSKLFKSIEYSHPVMDQDREVAVKNIKNMQGESKFWIAGAWMGNGFHESGFQSGREVAEKIIGIGN